MAEPISATVAFVAAAWSSAVAVTATAVTAVTAGAISGAAATAVAASGLKFLATTALSLAASALLRPNTPSSGTALDFKPDPKAPIRGLMGYHATGGSKVMQTTYGYNGVIMSLGVALSLGPIDQITQFQADGVPVVFSGANGEAAGFYQADMFQQTTKGLPTDGALLPPPPGKYGYPLISNWDSTYAAKGAAFAFWTMALAKNPEDRDIFVNGVPDPRWIGRWMKLYDWRKDSTYPGGSGSHRENDWRTWEFSENPYVHARAWLRGHVKMNDNGTLDRNKRIAGVGVPASAIDMAAFTEAANIADANLWKISGEWSTTDQKWQVLASMLQAGSGVPINRGAQVSVMINTPRVSTYTYSVGDMVGSGTVRPLTRRRDRKNTIVPRYRSEPNNWEYVAAKDVTSSVYRAEDRDEPRTTEVQYSYVRDAKQAAQLAAYDLANIREGLTITLPSKVHLMHIHAGDCITVNVPEMALASQKFIVMRTNTDYKGAVTTLECRSETEGKHAFALGQAANPPPSPALSAVDPLYIPPPTSDDVTVTPKPPVGGTSQPIIIVDAPVDRGDISAVVVEYGLSATGPWLSAGPADPATGQYQISGLNPGASYWISTRYVANNGTISERYIQGPETAPGLTAGDISPDSPTVIDLNNSIADLEDAVESETVIRQDQITALQVQGDGSMNRNPTFSAWSGALPVSYVVLNPANGTISKVAGINGNPNAVRTVTTGAAVDFGFNQFTEGAAPGGERCVVSVEFTLIAGNLRGSGFTFSGRSASAELIQNNVHFLDEVGAGTVGRTYRISKMVDGRNANTTRYGLNLWARNNSLWPANTAVTLDWGRASIRPATPEEIAAGTAIPALQASVTTNTSAIVNLETQQALAKYEVVAVASGGKPARLKLVSSSLGSAIALDAPYVYFGDNTVFEDATDTLVTTIGTTRYITAWGAPFGPDNLTYWVGPSTVATASATKANAMGANGQWRDNSGASFFGGATLSAPFDSGTPAGGTTLLAASPAWTDIVSYSSIMTNNGFLLSQPVGEILPVAIESEGGWEANWRIVTTDIAGGDLVVVQSGTWTGAWQFTPTWRAITPLEWGSFATNRSGQRIVKMQARRIQGASINVRNMRIRGYYAS